ncbi:MAG: methyltransferase domain-containing protein [Patescibacteria group bacterium]
MTIWDQIYKNHQKGGDAWATLSEGIDPRFIDLVDKAELKLRSAFDIGCGTGKYLRYLQSRDFQVAGIDSSETAVEMSKKSLGDSADIVLADMYDFKIPKNKYDLILSVSTLHHGTKEQIQGLISQICDNLSIDGKIFITLPDIECNKKWNTFKDDKEIAPGTYSPLSGPEKGLPHSFFSKKEIESLFLGFRDVSLSIDKIGRWFVVGTK